MRQTLLLFLTVALSSQAQPDTIITVNVENDAVKSYMEEVLYMNHDDVSRVQDYNVAPPARRDIPNPAVVPMPETEADSLLLVYGDSADYSGWTDTITVARDESEAEIYNLLPQSIYYYKVEDGESILTQGEIHTEGQVRMIYVPGANNIRDMGGWLTADGKRVKYGKLFRGSDLNGNHSVDSASMEILKTKLNIQAELDMRATWDEGYNVSVFGFTANTLGNSTYSPYYYTNDSGQLFEHISDAVYKYRWRREFTFIVNNLKRNRSVYHHCVWGGDRTGYLSLFLEGLLGVDYDGMVKDYELSTFYRGIRVKSKIDPVIDTIMTYEGNTLQEKFNSFFLKTLGNTQADIDYFREAMLEDAEGSNGGESGDEGNDNPTTAIRNIRHDEATMPVTVYDLRGRVTSQSAKRGLVIVRGSDGAVRKMLR